MSALRRPACAARSRLVLSAAPAMSVPLAMTARFARNAQTVLASSEANAQRVVMIGMSVLLVARIAMTVRHAQNVVHGKNVVRSLAVSAHASTT
jgi:hypothetical protein